MHWLIYHLTLKEIISSHAELIDLILTLSLLLSSAADLFKQFGPRLFDTLIVFLNEFFEKSQQTTK